MLNLTSTLLLQTTRAAADFSSIIKHPFALLHCWEIMKDQPKWQDPKSQAFGKEATGDGFGEDPINLGDDISAPTALADNRPMGVDRAKAGRKKANSDAASASSSEYASMMQEMSLRRISIMQAEILVKVSVSRCFPIEMRSAMRKCKATINHC